MSGNIADKARSFCQSVSTKANLLLLVKSAQPTLVSLFTHESLSYLSCELNTNRAIEFSLFMSIIATDMSLTTSISASVVSPVIRVCCLMDQS